MSSKLSAFFFCGMRLLPVLRYQRKKKKEKKLILTEVRGLKGKEIDPSTDLFTCDWPDQYVSEIR